MRFETEALHVGEEPNLKEGGSGDVVAPVHLSTTFARREIEKPTAGFEYSRTGNPTRQALERRLAALEGTRHGLAFSSGMAAETVLALTLLESGDHVVAFDDLYGGTRRLFTSVFERNVKASFTYVDARDPEKVREAMGKDTRMVWLESPTNPLLKLCDIRQVVEIAHERGAIVVVDNTFMSPYFQQPLRLGADVVVHSTTKYLNGHSDSVGGAIMLDDEGLFARLLFNQNAIGAILSPFDSYLVLRGVKTLALRMERHAKNALKVARFLEGHERVKRVIYPGLESHPQHSLAKRQMSGFGGMLSFELDGGIGEAKRFLSQLRLVSLAESLGCVESLIEHPALMTHSSVAPAILKELGITPSLLRMSVGIEHQDDLIEDIGQALGSIR